MTNDTLIEILTELRDYVEVDRDCQLASCVHTDGHLDPEDEQALKETDALLRRATDAINEVSCA